MTSNNTQLTSASGYNTDRMILSEPQIVNIPNSSITYKRINIGTRNEDGTTGDLIFPTEKLFTFGVQENLNLETNKVNGYTLPLCLYSRDGPTKEEKEWGETMDRVAEQCKTHLIDNREEIEAYDLTRNDLKKMNPLYWKKDKGKIVPGKGPTLYTKLLVSKKQNNKIISMFYNKDGQEIDPLTLLNKRCDVTAYVKVESIYIGGGGKMSLQIKLYECEVSVRETGMRRMGLKRPKVSTQVSSVATTLPMENEDSDASLEDSDEDEIKPKKLAPVTTEPKKPAVKRKVKKVVRKAVNST